jgi:hypothetical protein
MDEVSITNYKNDLLSKLINSFNKGLISLDTFEKAKRDLSKLIQKPITDVNGFVRNVWVLREEHHPADLKHKAGDTVTTKDGRKHIVIGYKGITDIKGSVKNHLYTLQDEQGNTHDKLEHNLQSVEKVVKEQPKEEVFDLTFDQYKENNKKSGLNWKNERATKILFLNNKMAKVYEKEIEDDKFGTGIRKKYFNDIRDGGLPNVANKKDKYPGELNYAENKLKQWGEKAIAESKQIPKEMFEHFPELAEQLKPKKLTLEFLRSLESNNFQMDEDGYEEGKTENVIKQFENLDIKGVINDLNKITESLKIEKGAFNIKLTDSSLTIKFSSINIKANNINIAVDRVFSIKDAEKFVDNYTLFFNEKFQNNGVGKQIHKIFDKQNQNMNIDKITTSAGGKIGGYAWARAGYRTDREVAQYFLEDMKEHSQVNNKRLIDTKTNERYQITQNDYKEAEKRFNNFYSKPENEDKLFPMNLLATIGPNNKAGKALLIGNNWEGVIDYKDPQQKADYQNYINKI